MGETRSRLDDALRRAVADIETELVRQRNTGRRNGLAFTRLDSMGRSNLEGVVNFRAIAEVVAASLGITSEDHLPATHEP